MPRREASAFGVIETADDGEQITAFLEKPPAPPGLPGRPDEIFASMGNYVFSTKALLDAAAPGRRRRGQQARHGRQHHPEAGGARRGQVYDFRHNNVPGEHDRDRGYWRDVGTLDSFYEAHMDLISIHPVFNLYNYEWPIYTENRPWPPAKFVHGCRSGWAGRSTRWSPRGAVISGSLVENACLPQCEGALWAHVEGSVLMEGVDIGRHAVIRNAILDKNVQVPEGAEIGVDKDEDRARGFAVSEAGVTVIGKGVEVLK